MVGNWEAILGLTLGHEIESTNHLSTKMVLTSGAWRGSCYAPSRPVVCLVNPTLEAPVAAQILPGHLTGP